MVYQGKYREINKILEDLFMTFHQPEEIMFEQFDEATHMHIIGKGSCFIKKCFDGSERLTLDIVNAGYIDGVQQCLFAPQLHNSMISINYSILGSISIKSFKKSTALYPKLL